MLIENLGKKNFEKAYAIIKDLVLKLKNLFNFFFYYY